MLLLQGFQEVLPRTLELPTLSAGDRINSENFRLASVGSTRKRSAGSGHIPSVITRLGSPFSYCRTNPGGSQSLQKPLILAGLTPHSLHWAVIPSTNISYGG